MQNYYVELHRLRPGDELVVPKSNWDIIQHRALYLGYDSNGTHWIIHNIVGFGVTAITMNEFFAQVRKVNAIIRYSGSNVERKALVQRALKRIGKPYSLIDYNCEHFTSEVKTGVAVSPQLKIGLGVAAAFIVVAIVFK